MPNVSTCLIACMLLVAFACSSRQKESSRLDAPKAPEENRFIKNVLIAGLKEPMELVITRDGAIFWIERYGSVYLYSPGKGDTTLLGKLNVFSGHNEGLLGLALDPGYESNHHLYLFYSPAGEIPKEHISRFEVRNNRLDLSSEKIVLEIPTQRELCCHSAGSLAFAPNGDLYIATGDNTNPWESDGYSPHDERPGRENFDAQRTAANTQDLRGKIVRIHPEADGTYTIPDGNLFPKDGSKGKPEIYAMGVRNPFRISVDAHTGYLYFGDIGPDGNKGGEKGPEAYDEINFAPKPGNFGWPYFVANNRAYPKVDFNSQAIGQVNDPVQPVNLSPNNTGIQQLPPVQKAMIWYSGEETKDFVQMGKGGRSAMAGPVYYFDKALKSEGKFPDYYNHTLFIYEWMRDWIKVVKLDESGNFAGMDNFMPSTEFSSPIDMTFGPDGTLYVLEYGSGWYSNNKDARISQITFHAGNRPPTAVISANTTAGKAPLTVQFSTKGTIDNDHDPLQYQWNLDTTGTNTPFSTEANPTFTFTKEGVYHCQLVVSDSKGAQSKTNLEILVGNTPPQVEIELAGNQQFFWPHKPVNYWVKVIDQEDGSLAEKEIPAPAIEVFLDYLSGGENLSPILTERQKATSHPGEQLIAQSDCKSCHLADKSSAGPSFKEIALRYKDDSYTVDKLAEKVIKGGGGAWKRNFVMIAHPTLSLKAAQQMVSYILSLDEALTPTKRIAVSGKLNLSAPQEKDGLYRISASYTDKGGAGIKSLTQSTFITLKPPTIQAESYDKAHRMKVIGELEEGDNRYLSNAQNGSNVVFKNIDLTDIRSLTYRLATTVPGVQIEVRLDTPDGDLFSKVDVPVGKKDRQWIELSSATKAVQGKHDLYLKVICTTSTTRNVLHLDWFRFNIRTTTKFL